MEKIYTLINETTSKNVYVVNLDTDQMKTLDNVREWAETHGQTIKCDLIVFDYSYRYCRSYGDTQLYEIIKLANLTTDWVIVTSNFSFYKSTNPRIVYYPAHIVEVLDCELEDIDIVSYRENYLGFLSFHMHPHRLIALVRLFKQGWFNKCLINFTLEDAMNYQQKIIYDASLKLLTDEELTILDQIVKTGPYVADPSEIIKVESRDYCTEIDLLSIDNIGFTDCYINMLTESDYDIQFITEKSIKPFLTGQLWAVFGNQDLSNHLKELGLDIMEDYLTPNFKFDDPNLHALDRLRKDVEQTISQISNLLPNIEEVWDATYCRRKYNYELVRSPKFLEMLRRPIVSYLKGV
jgi:hypothetical protein